jgi:hypothetical protein
LWQRPGAVAVGQRLPELATGGDVELGEYLGQVVLDRAGLRNSWAAISGFDMPARARRAIWASCGVSPLPVPAVRLRTVYGT